MRFELSIFKFDHQSDYLPYYTKHPIKIGSEKTLFDIFNTINEDQPFSYEKDESSIVVINGVYTYCNITVEELKEHFGKDLCIEPISIQRAHSDLLINDDDFKARFEILSSFASLEMLSSYTDQEIVNAYDAYKIYYYASNTLNYEKEYMGDAILLLAYDLIQKFPNEENAILKALASQDVGVEYHTRLNNRIYNFDPTIEEKISYIQQALKITSSEQNFRVNHTRVLDFGQFENSTEIKHDFKEFNIAYYEGQAACDNTTQLLNTLKARHINLENRNNDLALNTFHVNPDLTYKLASTVMLEAFDQNADFIVVDSDELFYLFDYNRKELKRVAGREVILPVLHKNELEKLALGIHGSVKETLSKHAIDPEII